MSISEQVKEIKACAYAHEASGDAIYGTANILYQAADTIKALSAKLAAANVERSDRYYGGGWIACKDRRPEEKGWYLVYAKNQRPFVAYFKGKTFPLNNHYHEIIAWQPLPEPYHEP